MPATRITRSPPEVGTANGCDTSFSPSTVTSAIALVPPFGRPVNSARPCASVVADRVAPPTVTLTCCPGALLPIASRTTRTVTVPFGKLRRRDRAAVDQRRIGHVLRRAPVDRDRQAPRKLPTPKKTNSQSALLVIGSSRSRLHRMSAVLAEARVGIVARSARRARDGGSGKRDPPYVVRRSFEVSARAA